MLTASQGTSCCVSSANIAHGVCPPLTAKWKLPPASTAARASSATNVAPAAATAAGSGRVSSSCCMPGLLLPLGVAAELAAPRRQDLAGELADAPRVAPLVQRVRHDRRRDRLVHGREPRPPTLAGGRGPAGGRG